MTNFQMIFPSLVGLVLVSLIAISVPPIPSEATSHIPSVSAPMQAPQAPTIEPNPFDGVECWAEPSSGLIQTFLLYDVYFPVEGLERDLRRWLGRDDLILEEPKIITDIDDGFRYAAWDDEHDVVVVTSTRYANPVAGGAASGAACRDIAFITPSETFCPRVTFAHEVGHLLDLDHTESGVMRHVPDCSIEAS